MGTIASLQIASFHSTISAGNSPVTGEFPAQMLVTRSFDVFFDLRLNKRWVNNRGAVDLRRDRAYYDDTVKMEIWLPSSPRCIQISNGLKIAQSQSTYD